MYLALMHSAIIVEPLENNTHQFIYTVLQSNLNWMDTCQYFTNEELQVLMDIVLDPETEDEESS